MKILQILPELEEGGVERGTVELNRELAKRGYESVVVSEGGKLARQIEADGGTHITFPAASKNPISAPSRIRALRQLLQEVSPDVVHARSRVPAWLTWFANRPLRIPFVTTVHGFNSVNAYSKVMTYGDRVICVSNAVRDYIVKHYATPSEKLVVIPRGIDTTLFDPEHIDNDFIDTFKRTHGLEGKLIISTVGRITQLKDLETFIHAIALMKKETPDIRGLIVGGVHKDKHDYFTSLKILVKKLNLEEEIVFAGSQSRVAEIYALSDVVVSSSKKPESFGRSVAEAIAMNTPVVATRHGGVLDIVQEGVHGYFYTPGNAGELADTIKRARRLRFDGHRYIFENFSLEKMVEDTLKVYAKVKRDG